MRRRQAAAGVLAGFAVLAGCGAPRELTTEVAPTFAPAAVRAVAVLPFFEWQLSIDDTRAMTTQVVEAIGHRNPSVTIIAPEECSELLSTVGLTYDWALYLLAEQHDSLPDVTVVQRMSDALGADVIAHVRFTEVLQTDGSSQFGPAVSGATVELRFFSGESGAVEWRSAATTAWSGSDEGSRAVPLSGMVKSAFATVVDSIPRLGQVDLR